jgi:hypothetical protein
MAALIREAVERAYPPTGTEDARWEIALSAVGGLHSGRTDISTEHDRELDDAFGE